MLRESQLAPDLVDQVGGVVAAAAGAVGAEVAEVLADLRRRDAGRLGEGVGRHRALGLGELDQRAQVQREPADGGFGDGPLARHDRVVLAIGLAYRRQPGRGPARRADRRRPRSRRAPRRRGSRPAPGTRGHGSARRRCRRPPRSARTGGPRGRPPGPLERRRTGGSRRASTGPPGACGAGYRRGGHRTRRRVWEDTARAGRGRRGRGAAPPPGRRRPRRLRRAVPPVLGHRLRAGPPPDRRRVPRPGRGPRRLHGPVACPRGVRPHPGRLPDLPAGPGPPPGGGRIRREERMRARTEKPRTSSRRRTKT